MECENNKIIHEALHSLDIEIETLKNLKDTINLKFVAVVETLFNSKGRIVISGIGKSAIIAQKMVASFNSTGTPSLFLHAADAIHGDLGMIMPDDEVIIISKSGNTPEVKVLTRHIRELGNDLIGITANLESYLAKEAKYILHTPIAKEADPNNLAPTASTLAQAAIGDALCVSLISKRGFSRDSFARNHPGGMLGKELFLKVEDILIESAKPMIGLEASIKEIIVEISSKRMGATAVIGVEEKLEGIITDGDLRRMLQDKSIGAEIKAKDIMSVHPLTIRVQDLAVNALSVMREKSVSQLLVLKGEKYQGMIHIHDILKEGIL